MMDLDTIVSENRKATNRAKRHGKRPYQFTAVDLSQLAKGYTAPLGRIPTLGDYEPKGYTLLASRFVDSSGFGGENEPAWSIGFFCKHAVKNPANFYAISQVGQFQLYINEFSGPSQTT